MLNANLEMHKKFKKTNKKQPNKNTKIDDHDDNVLVL